MNAADTPAPTVGQIWQDNDKRGYGRKIRIIEIDATHATVELVTGRQVPTLHGSRETAKPGRRTRIRLNRFRPTSTGYRYISGGDA
ncbi:hypothetical protein [Streptomyces sp. AM6-12]|uniref:hypothetical protein n=1 Tax=Streptomyces sp. AM6-12 TaxID=3345149 RepID=UPI003789E113